MRYHIAIATIISRDATPAAFAIFFSLPARRHTMIRHASPPTPCAFATMARFTRAFRCYVAKLLILRSMFHAPREYVYARGDMITLMLRHAPRAFRAVNIDDD